MNRLLLFPYTLHFCPVQNVREWRKHMLPLCQIR